MWTFVGRPPQPYSHTHTHKHALIWPQFNANRVNRQLYFMGFCQALRLIDLDRISSFVLWTLSHRIQTDAKQVQWTKMRCIVYLQHPQNAHKIHRICVNIASSVAKLLCVCLLCSNQIHCIPHSKSPSKWNRRKVSRINSVNAMLLSGIQSIYDDSIEFSPISFTFLLGPHCSRPFEHDEWFQFMVSFIWSMLTVAASSRIRSWIADKNRTEFTSCV